MLTWLRAVARWLEANHVLAPVVLTHVRDVKRFVLFGGPRELTSEDRRARGRMVREACERLGVTYIKLAQFLTTRPDYVPPEYMEELEQLQDEVPPEPFEEVKAQLEAELGPMDEVFDWFEEEPISGASIAQVHRASIDGEEVAVKVQRPGLERTVDADLTMLAVLAPLGAGFLRLIGQRSHAKTLEGILGMFRDNIRHEIDFVREKEIMDEIRRRVEQDGLDDDVVIPETKDAYCTGRVITMSYDPGIKIKDVDELEAAGVDLEHAVDTITEIYLRMPFDYQTFQADPHYGNIAVNEDGQVIVYDYGIAMRVAEFDDETEAEELLEAFRAMFVGIGLQDPDVVVNALIAMDVVDPTDPDIDVRTLREMSGIMVQDVAGGGISHEDIERVEEMMFDTMSDHPLRINQDVVLPFRTTVGVEGLCANVLPEYDFSAKLAEFFLEGDVDLPDKYFEEIGDQYEEERERRRRARARRTNMARVGVTGGAAALGGGAASALGALSPAAIPAYLLAGGGLLWVWHSFRSGGVVGPAQYATRYQMEQWEDDETGPETADGGVDDGTVEELADQYLD